MGRSSLSERVEQSPSQPISLYINCSNMQLDNKSLQVEDGNYTRIINPIIEHLVNLPFKGCELNVALWIIRQTYGFNKTEDEISLSQFSANLGRSKQTIIVALKNLQLVKVVRLVKKSYHSRTANLWQFNKYFDTWELVNLPRLVKRKGSTSLVEPSGLVYIPRHTKDTTKDIYKRQDEPNNKLSPVVSPPIPPPVRLSFIRQPVQGECAEINGEFCKFNLGKWERMDGKDIITKQ